MEFGIEEGIDKCISSIVKQYEIIGYYSIFFGYCYRYSDQKEVSSEGNRI